MTLSYILPRTENIRGSDCTGVDGTANRTYVLADSSALPAGLGVIINGTHLHEGVSTDFTFASGTLTFLNIVDNTDYIRINYFITSVSASESSFLTSTSLRYATPLMLASSLGIRKDVPSWDVSGTPTNEAIGTGNNVITEFYLAHQDILSDSYTIYANGVEMTETTHYVLTNDTGLVTLTAEGVTLLSTNALTGKYSYISNLMKNSYLIQVLTRAEDEVDSDLNTTFTDGSVVNPEYPSKTEYLASKGNHDREYFTEKRPLINLISSLDGAITSSDTTISVVSTSSAEDFPSTGNLMIGSEIITYTGVSSNDFTGCSRGVLGSTAAAHVDGYLVSSTVIRVSDTSEGTSPSWTAQEYDVAVYVDEDGKVKRYKCASPDLLSAAGVEKRIEIRYLHGYNTIPGEITRLTLIFAKRQLVQDNISKSMIQGRNEFRPEMFNVDMEEIKRIHNSWAVLPMGNT